MIVLKCKKSKKAFTWCVTDVSTGKRTNLTVTSGFSVAGQGEIVKQVRDLGYRITGTAETPNTTEFYITADKKTEVKQ